MGAGRSGSTILGVTLGNCANIFYAGELDKWLVRSGAPRLPGVARERFWEKVRAGVNDPEPLFGRRAHQCLERSSALFRIRDWRARRRLRKHYLSVNEELYRSIARTAGVTHVVDSSHYPLRARELQKLDGVEFYLVFLVRDPRSVVASFNRDDVPEPRFNELTTNAYLWLTHLLSLSVFLRQPRERRLLLRHEDFRADPEAVLQWVLRHVDSAAVTPDLTSLSTGFPLVGNRLINSDVVALKRSGVATPRRALRLTRMLQLPWTLIFSALRPVSSAARSPGEDSAAG
jgi:Sulfotransferase family